MIFFKLSLLDPKKQIFENWAFKDKQVFADKLEWAPLSSITPFPLTAESMTGDSPAEVCIFFHGLRKQEYSLLASGSFWIWAP